MWLQNHQKQSQMLSERCDISASNPATSCASTEPSASAAHSSYLEVAPSSARFSARLAQNIPSWKTEQRGKRSAKLQLCVGTRSSVSSARQQTSQPRRGILELPEEVFRFYGSNRKRSTWLQFGQSDFQWNKFCLKP